VNCLESRDLLAEYAVGALSPMERRRVERHMETCPGCAKEAGELVAAASAAAFELPPVAPRAGLEERVVQRVTDEARKGKVRKRHAARALWVAAACAALLAAGALGGAFAMRGQVADLQNQVNTTRISISELKQLIHSLAANGHVGQVQMVPLDRRISGGGTGIIFSSQQALDWMFMQTTIGHPSAGTYRVVLATRGGRTIDGGTLTPLGKDQYVMAEPGGPREFTQNLSQVAVVIVLAPDGRPVLRGVVRPSTGT
jgi:hypothetical protein